ncbi:uncharacterized protein LOC127710934 [Mytilus californianus]|uniref:uncharacterized protein LOC127710934 n=1 Tax=Mytilus californianus TaxID=6549 RepID=UPI00224858BD|nr:uncharacterized protein LOC127710934 [Mytilus californianus]XP_052072849.1 uncharacterized protein LOC127710934 [Mytilus californianus]
MKILVLSLTQIWIIFYLVHVTKPSVILNRLTNTTKTGVIDSQNSSKPVFYNLDRWLANQVSKGKTVQSITIIPVLAIIAFVWIICLRVCKWMREDSKFHERGCSYDVTSYVIVTQEDQDFNDLDISTSHLVYDTVTSKKGLQNRIDHKMYDTVTSYASLLKYNTAMNARRSPTPEVLKPEVTKGTVQKKGRFYIAPVIDNYVRLKNSLNSKKLKHSLKQPSLQMRNISDLSSSMSYENRQMKRSPRRSVSDSRLFSTGSGIDRTNRRNVSIQVKKGVSKLTFESVILREDYSTNKPTECSTVNPNVGDVYILNDIKDLNEICDCPTAMNNNKFHTTAMIHANCLSNEEEINQNSNISVTEAHKTLKSLGKKKENNNAISLLALSTDLDKYNENIPSKNGRQCKTCKENTANPNACSINVNNNHRNEQIYTSNSELSSGCKTTVTKIRDHEHVECQSCTTNDKKNSYRICENCTPTSSKSLAKEHCYTGSNMPDQFDGLQQQPCSSGKVLKEDFRRNDEFIMQKQTSAPKNNHICDECSQHKNYTLSSTFQNNSCPCN